MKKNLWLVAITFFLAACGVHEENGYKATTELDLDGKVSIANFNFDEKGEVLYWGEQDEEFGDDVRTKIWNGKDIKELDVESKIQWSTLTNNGKFVQKKVNKTQGEVGYSLIEYDPIKDEFKEFVNKKHKNNGASIIGSYIENPRTYITGQNIEFGETKVKGYVWQIDEKEYEDIDLTELIQDKIDLKSIDKEPLFLLSDNGRETWVIMDSVGILHYDIESEEIQPLLLDDQIYSLSPMLTEDEKYLIYEIKKEDVSVHALDLDTLETKELNDVEGKRIALSNGNIAYVKDDTKIQEVDVATDEEKTLYEIKIKDGYELDLATISPDKSTIAYSYRKSKEDDGVIQILKKENNT